MLGFDIVCDLIEAAYADLGYLLSLVDIVQEDPQLTWAISSDTKPFCFVISDAGGQESWWHFANCSVK